MKNFLILCVYFLSFNTQAAQIFVPQEKFKDYADAVLYSRPNQVCYEGTKYVFVTDVLRNLTSVIILEGQQPVLILISEIKGVAKSELQVFTNTDFTKIEKMIVFRFTPARVNDGTITNPVIRDGFVLKNTYTCD